MDEKDAATEGHVDLQAIEVAHAMRGLAMTVAAFRAGLIECDVPVESADRISAVWLATQRNV